MVKCPRGSPSQVKANLNYINRQGSVDGSGDFSKGQPEKESETLLGESEGSELDSIKADKRSPPTARDELVYFFISAFLDILLESWDGKPCVKPKLGRSSQNSEEFGEDLGPCELSIVSSTAEYLNDLYRKRSSNLSKEKLKKGSETTDSEYINEEDFESVPDREKVLTDENVHFVLLNGVWYKGRVSRRLMDGEGLYFWEDGTTFQGEFEAGWVTGKGRLEFPDLSTYEGDLYKGFRHGEGMFCFSDSPVMYSGQWWLGKKHGHGLIVYCDPREGHNFYKGEWQDGMMEGFGFRQYLSGAKYIGFWSNGKRHGKGVMFWTNNDIYRGEWKEGLMHGYGEYTWSGFVNKSLSYPATNTYRGYWEAGKRNGNGVLELKNGSIIETVWMDDMKEGPGVVICENGAVMASERLFVQDNPFNLEKWQEKYNNISEKTSGGSAFCRTSSVVFSIPISTPAHNLIFYPHLDKLCEQLATVLEGQCEKAQMAAESFTVTPKQSFEVDSIQLEPQHALPQCRSSECERQRQEEENLLKNYIIMRILDIRGCYDRYSTLPCEVQPSFKCVLLRLFLWQMLIDGDVPDYNLSLVDIDDLIAREEHILIQDPHNPFERLQFWQFLQILIVLSWNIYGQYVLGEMPLVEDERVKDFLGFFGQCQCQNVLRMSFHYFIERHLFQRSPESECMNRFEERDFAPMEAMYVIYCNVGEPHSVRDFVNAICTKEDEEVPVIVRYFEKLPYYKAEGTNALTIAGELKHVPGEKRFNMPEIFQLERHETKPQPKSELTCFNGLKAKRVVRCLIEVCPFIAAEDCIVNMDYRLTFLEFYRAIILCAKLQLKMEAMSAIRDTILAEYNIQMEEYKKQLSEYEKQKEPQVVSRKRSRQFGDGTKKGKK